MTFNLCIHRNFDSASATCVLEERNIYIMSEYSFPGTHVSDLLHCCALQRLAAEEGSCIAQATQEVLRAETGEV